MLLQELGTKEKEREDTCWSLEQDTYHKDNKTGNAVSVWHCYLSPFLFLFCLPLLVFFHHIGHILNPSKSSKCVPLMFSFAIWSNKRSKPVCLYCKKAQSLKQAMRWKDIIFLFFLLSFFYLERTCLIFSLLKIN